MIDINKIVDKNSEKIIEIVNSLDNIKDFKGCFSDKANEKKIGRRQLKKLLNASKEANSIEEIKLFIAYQESKEKDNESWKQRIGNETLGKVILKKIDEVLKLIDVEELRKDADENIEKDIITLKIKLAEKFFGYFYWKGTIYGKEGGE